MATTLTMQGPQESGLRVMRRLERSGYFAYVTEMWVQSADGEALT